ncbi:hypothetical protein OG885_06695 [Streptomyces sp. NBC_00028]|uniref:hypothetical protein n=1 Tax=Streptomyces sp. NBC_00028 TaxID=2975624 RepID=UPI003254DB37
MKQRTPPAGVHENISVTPGGAPRPDAGPRPQEASPPPPDDAAAARPDRPWRRRFAVWRRNRWLAPLLAGLVVLGAGLAVVEKLPTSYATTSTISFAPRADTLVSADVIELIANKYAVVARASATVHVAAVAADVKPEDLRAGLSVTVEPRTANLDITVSLDDADQAARACNAIASVVDRSVRDDRLVSGEITDRADPAAAERHPPRGMLRLMVVAAALLAAGWAGFVVRQMDRRSGRSS